MSIFNKETLKSLVSFLIVVLYAMNLVGSTCYLIYIHQGIFALTTIFVSYLAFPRFREAWRCLMGKEE